MTSARQSYGLHKHAKYQEYCLLLLIYFIFDFYIYFVSYIFKFVFY